MSKAWLNWLPAIFVYGLVWYGSSLPGSSLQEHSFFEYDKVLHLLEYTVVGLSLAWALRHRLSRGWGGFAIRLLAIGILWGLSDEIHQYFVGRDASLLDLLADTGGLLVATQLVRLPLLRRQLERGLDVRAA